jgi:hypothetical protein
MSNAFNLSQLANFVDSSGKLNVATGSTGTLPTTQGGTGLTTVGTNGQVLQSNGTSLTWATPSSGGVTSLNGQTGAITDTTQYAIGSYVLGRPVNVTNYNNSTIAGSSLYASSTGVYVRQGVQEAAPFGPSFSGNNYTSTSHVNTGSWRCVSIAAAGLSNYSSEYSYEYQGSMGLWVRYA